MNRKRIATGAGLSLGAAFALTAPAQAAADIEVDTLNDTAPDSLPNNGCEATGGNECTLREATLKANADSGQDTIVFASGLTGQIDLVQALGGLSLTEGVQIIHTGDPADLTVNGGYVFTPGTGVRIFDVQTTATGQSVAIEGLTLQQGYSGYGAAVYMHKANRPTLNLTNDVLIYNTSTAGGGAVYAYANVTISNSTVTQNYNTPGNFGGGAISARYGLSVDQSTFSENYSGRPGGAIIASGDVTIARSMFDQNSSDSNGGAIRLDDKSAGTAEISGSTFTGNFGNYGGAIHQDGGNPLTISSSTFSGNKSAESGGAISSSDSDLTVEDSTITGNHASYNNFTHYGGGISVYLDTGDALSVTGSTVTGNSAYMDGGISRRDTEDASSAHLDNTIVAGNTKTATDPGDTDLHGAFTGSFDLVQSLGGATLTGSSNILGQDPQLGPLASNGGPTQTRLPAQTSPVIDKGNAFGLTTDQRGLARTSDMPSVANVSDGTDIGAVELQAPASPTIPPAQAPPKKKCKKKHKKHKKHSASAAKKCKKKKQKKG